MENLKTEIVRLEFPEDANIILGQSHFIKTAEDIYEALVNAVPNIKFGVAFCEASMKCLIRVEGNDDELKELAARNAFKISAGHSFIIILKNAYPINVLGAVKGVPEVCSIYCATANPVDVIICETEFGRGILGVVDGYRSKGIETEEDVKERKNFLRTIGYKLG